MFAMSIEPLLPGLLLARIERALLHFQKPVHGLLGDLRADIRRVVYRRVHKAK
ncbi:hypothetical protein D3C76_1683140 [compost metagenome]